MPVSGLLNLHSQLADLLSSLHVLYILACTGKNIPVIYPDTFLIHSNLTYLIAICAYSDCFSNCYSNCFA